MDGSGDAIEMASHRLHTFRMSNAIALQVWWSMGFMGIWRTAGRLLIASCRLFRQRLDYSSTDQSSDLLDGLLVGFMAQGPNELDFVNYQADWMIFRHCSTPDPNVVRT